MLRHNIAENEACGWLVVDDLPEDLSIVDQFLVMVRQQMSHLFLSWRLGLLDYQDLSLHLHAEHQCSRLLAMELVFKVDIRAPIKATVLVDDQLDVLHFTKLAAEVSDSILSVASWEV